MGTEVDCVNCRSERQNRNAGHPFFNFSRCVPRWTEFLYDTALDGLLRQIPVLQTILKSVPYLIFVIFCIGVPYFILIYKSERRNVIISRTVRNYCYKVVNSYWSVSPPTPLIFMYRLDSCPGFLWKSIVFISSAEAENRSQLGVSEQFLWSIAKWIAIQFQRFSHFRTHHILYNTHQYYYFYK